MQAELQAISLSQHSFEFLEQVSSVLVSNKLRSIKLESNRVQYSNFKSVFSLKLTQFTKLDQTIVSPIQ